MHFAFLFPRFKLLSGAERLILKLSEAIATRGIRITLLCHQFDESCRPILPESVSLLMTGRRLDYVSNRYMNAAADYFRAAQLAEIVPEDANAVCCFGPGLGAAPALKKRKKPVLYFCYEPPRFLYTDRLIIRRKLGTARIFTNPFFSLYRRRDQRMVRGVDAVLSNSQFGRMQIAQIYGRNSIVITHGLEPFRASDRRNEIRRNLNIRESDIVVLTVNYLHPRKRIDLFIDSVQIAAGQDPSIRGLIVGDGPERSTLGKNAGEAIRFAGFVPEVHLPDYYQAADMYLHTGRLETFGLSVIEASGNKLPVVSVNEGGPLESVQDGQTGWLRPDDPNLLAQELLHLASDPGLRTRMGVRGFEFVRNRYTWNQGAEDFINAVRIAGAD